MATPTNNRVNCDRLWVLGLLIAALILYGYNLGSLPLRDWDEGTVAMLAREMARSPDTSNAWLYPLLQGQPYWNKPPLIHWAIAISYSWFGISEWSTRLVPALISALSVPLFFGIAREVFQSRTQAICSAVVYLTLLPVVRHGRLAMLDGAVICWYGLTIWCLLRGRKQPRFYLGAGIGLGLICLTKGIMLGILLGVIAVLFFAWEQPRLLKNPYLGLAIALGVLPALTWYFLQYQHYGTAFIGRNLGSQSAERIWSSVDNNQQPPWYYLLEIAKYTLPWLIFLPGGIKLALQYDRNSWAKLAVVWGGVYLLAISLMTTKLPWYVMPFYPAFSLLVGAFVAKLWQSLSKTKTSVYWRIFGLLAIVTCGVSVFYWQSGGVENRALGIIFSELTITFTITAILLSLKSRYFLVVLTVGWYTALLLLFNSSHWIWELAEDYAVKPIAAMVSQHTPPERPIYVRTAIYRPSLAFYSDRNLVIVTEAELKRLWQIEADIYALLPQKSDRQPISDETVLDSTTKWQLITKNKDFRQTRPK